MKIQNNKYELHIRRGFNGVVVGVSDPIGEKCIVVNYEELPRLIKHLQKEQDKYDKARSKTN